MNSARVLTTSEVLLYCLKFKTSLIRLVSPICVLKKDLSVMMRGLPFTNTSCSVQLPSHLSIEIYVFKKDLRVVTRGLPFTDTCQPRSTTVFGARSIDSPSIRNLNSKDQSGLGGQRFTI